MTTGTTTTTTTEGHHAEVAPGMAERAMGMASGVLHTVEDLAAGVYHSGRSDSLVSEGSAQ